MFIDRQKKSLELISVMIMTRYFILYIRPRICDFVSYFDLGGINKDQ